MKRVVRVCLALLLGVLMTVNVFADAGMAQYPDYVTDYYMVVESPDGGIDFYAEASFDSTKLNTELIPNGTAFHIEGELTDNVNRIWGYTKYHGMTGYIPLDDCRMVTRSEAIKSELSIAETAAADYDYTTPIVKILYNGPGEKFGKVSGSIEIPAGTTVHVVKEAKLADGSFWGYTSYEYEGWIRLESLVNIVEEALENLVEMTDDTEVETDETVNVNGEAVADETVNTNDENVVDETVNTNGEAAIDETVTVNGEAVVDSESNAPVSTVGGVDESSVVVEETNTGDAVQTSDVENNTAESMNGEGNTTSVAVVAEPTATSTPKPTATSTPKPTATSTPKPTATSTPKPTATNTPKPTATNTPTPDPTATNTPTPDPTATSTPTPDPTATNTPMPDPTATNTPTPEATVTEEPDPTATTEPTVTMAPAEEEAEETPTPEVTEAVEDEQVISENVKEAGSLQNPIIWIGGICLLLIIILLIYHFIKKNK